MKPVMIQNPSSDNRFSRGMYGAFFVIGIAVIYFATLFRSDAWLILSITFALYGLLRLAGRLFAGTSEASFNRIEKIAFYLFVVSAICLIVYCTWEDIIPVQFFG
ncbi:hypothetical protein Pan153_56570 [Gimesia panareensis]|uniref:Uncharacterized protein n=2 Tax=Gimesia panareensis TaxID=2527978 RepID=A0A518FXI6_9PLAN|nr:hypothetical protein Pan153_56570 [Gimesia panareensis]